MIVFVFIFLIVLSFSNYRICGVWGMEGCYFGWFLFCYEYVRYLVFRFRILLKGLVVNSFRR